MDGDALEVIWGKDIKQDVFSRWVQGFQFSADEPLALVQQSGGPCAVLAPVQAYMIQRHLFDTGNVIEYDSDDWRNCPHHTVYMLLLHSLSHILSQSASTSTVHLAVLDNKQQYSNITGSVTTTTKLIADETDREEPVIVIDDDDGDDEEEREVLQSSKPSSSPGQQMDVSQNEASSVEIGSQVASLKTSVGMPSTLAAIGSETSTQFTLAMLSSALQNVNQSLGIVPSDDGDNGKQQEGMSTAFPQPDTDGSVGVPGEKRPRLDTYEVTTLPQSTLPKDIHDKLHSNIRIIDCSDYRDTVDILTQHFSDYQGSFGVLLFLYSVILTKGVDVLVEEMEDTNEPLIDAKYGHGSQSLVNLLLTGRAVTNVFDLDKDVSGLKLKGISQQSVVGFLTILEALRYCKVGSFLKTPQYPVWVIGSETHLTVAFSTERNLTAVESPEAVARRAFRKFDKEGDDFIATDNLVELMQLLDMETDSE